MEDQKYIAVDRVYVNVSGLANAHLLAGKALECLFKVRRFFFALRLVAYSQKILSKVDSHLIRCSRTTLNEIEA